jgi:hypothetical protein
MTIRDEIMYFLRDAMYRVGELGYEIFQMRRDGNDSGEYYREKRLLRDELVNFISTLYKNYPVRDPDIADIPNHLTINEETEMALLSKIQWYRDWADINIIAYIDIPLRPMFYSTFEGTPSSGPGGHSDIVVSEVGGSTFDINHLL